MRALRREYLRRVHWVLRRILPNSHREFGQVGEQPEVSPDDVDVILALPVIRVMNSNDIKRASYEFFEAVVDPNVANICAGPVASYELNHFGLDVTARHN